MLDSDVLPFVTTFQNFRLSKILLLNLITLSLFLLLKNCIECLIDFLIKFNLDHTQKSHATQFIYTEISCK